MADKRNSGKTDKESNLTGRSNALADLDQRIQAARKAANLAPTQPENETVANRPSDMGVALRLSSELVGGVLVGAAIGWGLDWAFGTSPIFLIIFLGLGSVTGIRNVLRSVKEFDDSRSENEVKQDRSGLGPAD